MDLFNSFSKDILFLTRLLPWCGRWSSMQRRGCIGALHSQIVVVSAKESQHSHRRQADRGHLHAEAALTTSMNSSSVTCEVLVLAEAVALPAGDCDKLNLFGNTGTKMTSCCPTKRHDCLSFSIDLACQEKDGENTFYVT
jgi:hypothetical protein